MKTVLMMTVALAAAISFADAAKAPDGKAAAGKAAAKGSNAKQVEARAQRMVKNALTLFESKEDDRAVGMLEAVFRMYPDSQARFNAALELGRHFIDKRVFDRALAELRKVSGAEDRELQAEALLLEGQLYVGKGSPSEAVMSLRRLTQEYPTSAYANDAYFMIGQIHFEAGRWARAAEAYNMVGTAVPEDALTNKVVLAEAGQRVFVHIRDKDLAILAQLGEKSYVTVESKSGDREKVELAPFGRGDGDFISSVRTVAEASQPNDGVLTVHGSEPLKAVYVDVNTEDGARDRKLDADARVVSSAAISFKDGAQRQRVRGVFVDQPAFLQLKDFDLDVSDQPDTARITVKAKYRERPEPAPGETVAPPPAPDAPWITRDEIELTLTETGPRTGIFAGRIVPRLLPSGTNAPAAKFPAGEIGVHPEEKLVAEYTDRMHLEGTNEIVRVSEATALVGGSTDPQSIVAHSSEAMVQAKKLLLEAQLLYKWGSIFKDVGLQENAKSKADEGLKRVADVFDLSTKNTLERQVLEEAYEARWNLLLVNDNLQGAIQTCQALVRRFPDTLLADRAFMQIANANIRENTNESLRSAVSVLGAVISLPNSTLKPEAQFRIGEVLESQARKQARPGVKPEFAAAMLAFKRCAESYPSSSFAGEAYKRIVDYNVSIKNYTSAQETLERVFQDYPDAPWLDEMLLKWGIVKYRMGDRDGAKEKFQRLVEEYPGGKAAKSAAKFIQKIDG